MACNPKGKREESHKRIELQLINMPIDSCSFRINHIITGKEVFFQEQVDLSKPIYLPVLEEDVYIAVFSWPRTLISHQVVRDRRFDRAHDVDEFQLTKPLYIDRQHEGVYRIEVTGNNTLEDLETKGSGIMQFGNVDCEGCDLADRYWKLFSLFFERKDDIVNKAKQQYYDDIENGDLRKGNDSFFKMEEFKKQLMKDDLLDGDIQELVAANPKSKVSTFFLFYQLYNHREFEKFKKTFELLRGEALESKYYRMVKKQYDALDG